MLRFTSSIADLNLQLQEQHNRVIKVFQSQTSSQPPRIFISSRQDELVNEREYLKDILRKNGIDSFVFEKDAGARPFSVDEVFLTEVANSDIYLGMFYRQFSAATIKEYREASRLGKPCLIYIKEVGNKRRDKRLQKFINSFAQRRQTYKKFNNILDLDVVCDDVMKLLTQSFRELYRLKTLSISDLRSSQASSLILSDSLIIRDLK